MLHHMLGDGVTLVDPAPAVARQTQRVLTRHGLQSAAEEPGAWRFVTTGDSGRFRATTASLLSTLLEAPGRPVLFEQIAVLNGNQPHDD
jgi:glutamate racemase